MAIARTHTIDFVSQVSTSPTTYTFDSGTRVGADDVMLVFVVYELVNTSLQNAVTALTYGGVAMTYLGTTTPATALDYTEFIEVWRLDDPSAGSNDFSITLERTGRDVALFGAIYSGAGANGPTFSADQDGSLNVFANMTKNASDSIVLVGGFKNADNAGPFIPQTNNTELVDANTSSANPLAGFSYFMNEITAASGVHSVGSTASVAQAGNSWESGVLAVELSAVSVGGAATISAVSSSGGASTATFNESLTITVDDNTGIVSGTVGGVAFSNIVLDGDGVTVTADAPLGLGGAPGASVGVVVNNGQNSNSFSVTATLPSGFSSVVSSVAYADLPVDSPFSGESEYSTLAVGDILIYDNAVSTYTISFSTTLVATITPTLTANIDVQAWFLDASDSHSADTGITTITFQSGVASSSSAVPADDNTTIPFGYNISLPYTSEGNLAIDTVSVLDHISNGIPYTSFGRIAAVDGALVSYVHNGIPFDENGKLVVATSGTVSHYLNGWPFTSEGRILVAL